MDDIHGRHLVPPACTVTWPRQTSRHRCHSRSRCSHCHCRSHRVVVAVVPPWPSTHHAIVSWNPPDLHHSHRGAASSDTASPIYIIATIHETARVEPNEMRTRWVGGDSWSGQGTSRQCAAMALHPSCYLALLYPLPVDAVVGCCSSSAPWHRREAVESLASLSLSLPLLSSAAGCFCSWLSCVELEGGETLLLLVAMCLIIFFCALSLWSRAGLSLPRGLWVTGWRFRSNSNRIKLYSIQVSGPTSKL
jgi:hypothetical protein